MAAFAPAVACANGFPQKSYAKTLVVKPVGGDFASPRLAVESVTDADQDRPYRILIHPGIYRDMDWHTKDWVDLVGIDRDTCVLDASLPDDHDPADISMHQTLWGSTNTLIANLHIRCKNMRYPFHPDVTQPSVAVRKAMVLQNVIFEHLGNNGAADHQRALGAAGDPDAVWIGTDGVGAGLASSCSIKADNCTFKGVRAGFGVHNRPLSSDPMLVQLSNCHLIATAPDGYALLSESIGSGQNDKIILRGCDFIGSIRSVGKRGKAPPKRLDSANHIEIMIEGSDNGHAIATSKDSGRVIAIAPRKSSADSLQISGSAASGLFGKQVAYRNTIEGSIDVSVEAFTMGQRLGDCSRKNKVMNVKANGYVMGTVVFSDDMTGVSNNEIISQINLALGYEAASLVAPGERYRPDLK